MIPFKINGTKYNIPTTWSDVTFEQYVKLLHAVSIADHISIFTGIPRETIENAELKNLEKINIALAFLTISPKFDLTTMVGPYTMPTDIRIQSVGQFEDLRALLMKLPKDVREDPELVADLYLEACAIYCQKLRDSRYNPNEVPCLKEELKGYSCAEVLGTGGFFLFRPLNSSPTIMNRFQKALQLLRKWIVGFPGYRKTLDFLLRYFGLAEK